MTVMGSVVVGRFLVGAVVSSSGTGEDSGGGVCSGRCSFGGGVGRGGGSSGIRKGKGSGKGSDVARCGDVDCGGSGNSNSDATATAAVRAMAREMAVTAIATVPMVVTV